MARKKQPTAMRQTHRFLYYDLTHTGTSEDFHYIDLAKTLSEMNRRLYRQGMVYHIANISVHDSQGDAEVRFATAPNTWMTHAAWKLAFRGWKQQRAKMMQDSALTSPKWADFKLYLNKDMVNDVDWPKTTNVEGQDVLIGEWDYADLTFAKNGTQYDNHAIGLLGPHSFSTLGSTSGEDGNYDGYLGAINILEDQRRQVVQADTEQLSDQVIIGTIGTSITQDIVEQIIDEGDNPPYPQTLMLGGQSNPTSGNDAFTIRECDIASQYSPIAVVGGFPVPCGLLQVETKSGTDDNTIGLLIELVPGDYKGVSAFPMGA